MLDLVLLRFVQLLVFLVEHLPERFALAIARGLVGLIFLCFPRFTRVARINLGLAFPEKSEAEREAIFVESKAVLARNVLSFCRIPKLSKEQAGASFDFSALEEVVTSLRGKHPAVGLLIPTMHFGSFELLAQAYALLHRPASYLARGFGFRRVDEWWNARRSRFGNEVFWRSGGYKEMVSRLQAGKDVVVLCDQNVKRNHAVFVDFFGRKAATTKAAALAAFRTGAQVLVVSSVDRGNGKYEVLFERLGNPRDETGDNEEKIAAFTAKMTQAIERAIRAHPEQWFWIHRRWKTRPAGEEETLYI